MEINLTEAETVGENVKALTVTHDGKKLLVLVIDTSKNLGPSSTGKMIGVGNTGGFTSLPGGLKGNVYIGRKAA